MSDIRPDDTDVDVEATVSSSKSQPKHGALGAEERLTLSGPKINEK